MRGVGGKGEVDPPATGVGGGGGGASSEEGCGGVRARAIDAAGGQGRFAEEGEKEEGFAGADLAADEVGLADFKGCIWDRERKSTARARRCRRGRRGR